MIASLPVEENNNRLFRFNDDLIVPCDLGGGYMNDIAATETPDQPRPVAGTGNRIASLDFIRGIAVMGILAANIVAFGQPMTAYMYPGAFTVPHSTAEDWMWVAQFVAIDGKMRGLFSLLFGAGLILFLEKAWAKGATRWLQVKRLFWLGLFGLVHYFLIWRGDILFLYACSGLAALLFVKLSPKRQVLLGLLGYFGGVLLYVGLVGFLPLVADNDAGITSQPGMAEMVEGLEASKQEDLADGRYETQLIAEGRHGEWVGHNVAVHGPDLGFTLLMFWFETLPLMLIGMALYRLGMFDGRMHHGRQRKWGAGLLIAGVLLTIPIAMWVKAGGLTFYGTLAAMSGWSMSPRLFMILGLASLLAMWGNKANGWLAERVSAAGRAAFTNYLGTSILMMLVFHGWGGGLFGQLGRSELYLVAIMTCAAMLAWSKPWLEHYRYGPLEWLWRCLTYGKRFALKR